MTPLLHNLRIGKPGSATSPYVVDRVHDAYGDQGILDLFGGGDLIGCGIDEDAEEPCQIVVFIQLWQGSPAVCTGSIPPGGPMPSARTRDFPLGSKGTAGFLRFFYNCAP